MLEVTLEVIAEDAGKEPAVFALRLALAARLATTGAEFTEPDLEPEIAPEIDPEIEPDFEPEIEPEFEAEEEAKAELGAEEDGNALRRIAVKDGVVMAPATDLHLDIYHCT